MTRLGPATGALCALVLTVACGDIGWAVRGRQTRPVTAPEIIVESAYSCSEEGPCKKIDHPDEIWLETGHSHDVRVRTRSTETQIQSSVSDTKIVEYDGDRVAGTPDGADITLTGKSLGTATLDVNPATGSDAGSASLRIRTSTPRVTVVGWVDGRAIVPGDIARDASKTVRAHFKNIEDAPGNLSATRRCLSAMAQLLVATMSPGTSLVFLDERSPEQDGLFAQAALVKSSANGKPPDVLTRKFIDDGDYRLLNDFSIAGGDRRVFSHAPRQLSRIGETPLPCGGAKMVRWLYGAKALAEWMEVGESDAHPLHDRRACRWRKEEVTQLSEGRVGRKGREIQKLLSRSSKTADDVTAWIWAAVSFNRNGTPSFDLQAFPTYFVYIDSMLDPTRTSKQGSFADFVNKDATSQYVLSGSNFDEKKCP